MNLSCCVSLIIDQVFHKNTNPSDALKLDVETFKLVGGEGARIFGSPSYFSTEPNFERIFQKLNRLLSGPSASSLPSLPTNSDPKDSTPSQMLNTQFVTQIPSTQPVGMDTRSDQSNQNRTLSVLETDVENMAAKCTSRPPSSRKDEDEEPAARPRRALDNIDQKTVIVSSKIFQETTRTLFYDAFQADNPFQSMKRVPRKFARIPREQQSLLDREDCWYKASDQVANLPKSIQNGLVDFIEQEVVASESSEESDKESISSRSVGAELDSLDVKILNTINRNSSPTKSRPVSRNIPDHEANNSMPEQARENVTSSVSQNSTVDLAVAFDMGEFADDEDDDMPLPNPIPPSTAINKSPTIQVKRTPREAESRWEKLSNRYHERKDHEDSSSNPFVIPATHLEKSSQPWQSSTGTERADEAPEPRVQPTMHSSWSDAKVPQPSAQNDSVRPKSPGLYMPRSTPAAAQEGLSSASSKQEPSFGSVSPQNPKAECRQKFAINSPSPSLPSAGSSPIRDFRISMKKRKKQGRGKREEDKFFANREVEDPKVAVKKIRQDFLAKYEQDAKAQEELPIVISKVDSLYSQKTNSILSLSDNKTKEFNIEIPTTNVSPRKSIQEEPSTTKHVTVVPSTSYEPEELPVVDHHDEKPTIKDFINGNFVDDNPTFEHDAFGSGSSTGPDEDFQPASSSPHIDSPRRSLVDSQELVLSIESEIFQLDVTQNNVDKEELYTDAVNMLHPDITFLKDEDDDSEGLSDDDLEQEILREETDFRQMSPVSEGAFQRDPSPITEEYQPERYAEDQGLDFGQQDRPDNFGQENGKPEFEQEIQEDISPEQIGYDEFGQQGNEQEDQEEAVHDEVTQERFSQAEFHLEDAPVSFYDKFESQYPDYTGTPDDFTTALVYLEWLLENGKFLPWILYDDFLNFYPEEYLALGGDKLGKKGYELFCEKIKGPIFRAEVISGNNLQDAISSLDKATVQKKRARFGTPEKATLDGSKSTSRARRNSMPPSPTVAPQPTPIHVLANVDTVFDKESRAESERELAAKPEAQPIKPAKSYSEKYPEEEPKQEPGIAEAEPVFETIVPKPKQVLRLPHFDTPSQAPPTKRKEPPVNLDSSRTSAKKHRTLPWQNKPRPSKGVQMQPQLREPRGTPRQPSPELGDEMFQSRSHRPSTRNTDPLRPISPPPLKDPNRRKTIGTDKFSEVKPKPRGRISMASTTRLDVGPSNPSIFAKFLKKNKERILQQSRSPSIASSVHSSSSKRRASRMETD